LKFIVGLGNPGQKYADTRHNVGFRVLDELARRHGLTFESAPASALIARVRTEPGALLGKPLTFMNLSGGAIAELARYFRIDVPDLLVIADDVNLPLGRLRARARGSAGGNNGLASVIRSLGTQEFARLRIGIGRGDARRDLADHVLSRFDPDERPVIEAAIERAADAVEDFIRDGIESPMNKFNREDPDEPSE
jgi:PTH1 family peptidyl-tRNA hydrolase